MINLHLWFKVYNGLELGVDNKVDTVVKIAIGAVVGWVVEQAAANVLRELGVPPHTAKVAGAVAGALL